MTLYSPNIDLGWLLHGFAPISLAGLNAKAEMLARIDNKYVVSRQALQHLIPDLSAQFDILEINQRRVFTYDTRYFDDANHSAYYHHHQGLRKRFKVRIRRYSDAGLSFLEVKVKGKRGMTQKHRMPHDPTPVDYLSPAAKDFASATYADHYGKPFHHDLHRVLDMRYKRITLVAKAGGERMTIDTDLQFSASGQTVRVGTGIFIIEAKSALGRGFADKTLRRAGQRPIQNCSKYCVGMAALGKVRRHNRFLPSMRQLGLVDAVVQPAPLQILAAA